MPRGLSLLLRLLAATAASLLGLFVVTLAGDAARLFLVLVGAARYEGVEFGGRGWFYSLPFLPRPLTEILPDGSGALYALYATGPLLASLVLLGLGSWRARRAGSWARLFWAHVVLWTSIPLVLQSGVLLRWPRGTLGAALRGLWPQASASRVVRLLATAVIAAALLWGLTSVLRRLFDAYAGGRAAQLRALLGWVVLPASLAALALNLGMLRYRSAWVVAWVLAPPLLALIVGAAATLAPRRLTTQLEWSTSGAVALLAALGVVVGLALTTRSFLSPRGRSDFVEIKSRHWRLYVEVGGGSAKNAATLAAEADARLEKALGRLALRPPNPHLVAYYYTSAQAKSARAGNDQPCTLEAQDKIVHHLLSPGGAPSDPRCDALLLLETEWGKPGSSTVAEALARFALGEFYDHPLADYAGRVTREEGAWSLREIFGLTGDYLSPLVRDALGGAWVEQVVNQRGREVLTLLYHAPLAPGEEEAFAAALGTGWDGLEEDWRKHLAAFAAAPEGRTKPASEPMAFQRGISFSHEVGGNYGYGSDRALGELKRIRSLGANAVAVVPYAFTRAPAEASLFTATDESDDRVIRTLEEAHRLGFATMLKPQLWGPGFTGDIAFARDADFDRWFEQYRRWLLHMARLAELHRVEVLVIGTELSGLTRREAAWRALIADLRRIYSGRLTYAAHWGHEFESLPFWDALDFLGLNMYHPLAPPGRTPHANSPHVRGLVERLAALSKKHGKPILFTEVGYPSLASAAAEPWKEGEAGLDTAMQEQCYRTVFEAFYDQPWLAGLYWWKWPSNGGTTRFDTTYSPANKPAAGVLERWYAKPPAANN